jgi:putative CocE/NonD family hydrolase
MRCRDGIALVARIWQPGGAGPWPVLLMRQPYGRAIASTITYAHPSWYARQGFLVVVQDVRGQGDSQGSFAGFRQEAADGADAVRWARHLPQSNGRVGTYGFSYQGLSQLLNDGGDGDPDSLPDCTVPAMAGPSERDHWACEDGAHWWALGLGWGLQLAALQCRRRGDGAGWQRLHTSLASGAFLHDGPALLQELDPEGMAAAWLGSDPSDPGAWRVHRLNPALLRRPMLLIGGWYDPHLRGVLELWRLARQAGGAPQLRIGAWSHLHWHGGIDRLQLAFFQRELLGRPPTPSVDQPEPPIRLECQTTGRWQQAGAEQLTEVDRCTWALRSDGLAAVDQGDGALLPAARGSGALTLVHDPWRPVPGRGGHLGLDAGPCHRHDLDARCDVACFTSPPLNHPLPLLGRPLLQISVQADQPGFDLCAALSRIGADGAVQQLSTGVLRQLGDRCLEPRRLQLAFQPLLAELLPGERLRLSLAGAAWPQVAVNPGDGAMPHGPATARHRAISLSLQLSDAQLSLQALVPGGSSHLGQTEPD